MALTPPPDGTATYAPPVNIHWYAYDLFATDLQISGDLANVLSDSDLAAINDIIDSAVRTAYPTLYITRSISWTPSTPPAGGEVVVQEAGA